MRINKSSIIHCTPQVHPLGGTARIKLINKRKNKKPTTV